MDLTSSQQCSGGAGLTVALLVIGAVLGAAMLMVAWATLPHFHRVRVVAAGKGGRSPGSSPGSSPGRSGHARNQFV